MSMPISLLDDALVLLQAQGILPIRAIYGEESFTRPFACSEILIWDKNLAVPQILLQIADGQEGSDRLTA
jgi:hypothetical protein